MRVKILRTPTEIHWANNYIGQELNVEECNGECPITDNYSFVSSNNLELEWESGVRILSKDCCEIIETVFEELYNTGSLEKDEYEEYVLFIEQYFNNNKVYIHNSKNEIIGLVENWKRSSDSNSADAHFDTAKYLNTRVQYSQYNVSFNTDIPSSGIYLIVKFKTSSLRELCITTHMFCNTKTLVFQSKQ